MADPFFAEIRIFGFNYSPIDWAYCDGSNMTVQQNTPLYSLIGTTYGGTVNQNFNLPNLMGQGVVGTGVSPMSGNQYPLNAKVGTGSITLNPTNIPAHDHSVSTINDPAPGLNTPSPSATPAGFPASSGVVGGFLNYVKTSPKPTMIVASPKSLATAGAANPVAHENRQPYLAMNFCICTNGGYPYFP